MIHAPLFVVALEPQSHPSGRVLARGYLRISVPQKGPCVPLFTTQETGKRFLTQNPPTVDIAALYIRDPQEMADILEVCRTDGDAKWVAVDPSSLDCFDQCVSIETAIEALLKQGREDHSNE